jgi:hypothetical protein
MPVDKFLLIQRQLSRHGLSLPMRVLCLRKKVKTVDAAELSMVKEKSECL